MEQCRRLVTIAVHIQRFQRSQTSKKKTTVPSRLNLSFSLLNLEHARGSDWDVDHIANLVNRFGESDVAEEYPQWAGLVCDGRGMVCKQRTTWTDRLYCQRATSPRSPDRRMSR
jgi:hypothetical protein